jgi:serine phosphatase RsbU (regulator of sigma subunit)
MPYRVPLLPDYCRRLLRISLILFLFTAIEPLSAEILFIPDNSHDARNMDEFIELLLTGNTDQQIDDIINNKETIGSIPLSKFTGYDVRSAGTSWLRITTASDSGESRRWFLEFQNIYIFDIVVYQLISEKGEYKLVYSLDEIVSMNNSTHSYLIPFISGKDKKVYYISLLTPGYSPVKTRYLEPATKKEITNITALGLGFFTGMVFILLVYNFMLFLFTRERNHAFLAGYLAVITVITLMNSPPLLMNFFKIPVTIIKYYPGFVALASLIFTIFAEIYLQMKRNAPLMYKLWRILVGATIIAMIANFVLPLNIMHPINRLTTPMLLIYAITIFMTTAIKGHLNGHRRALIFMIAYLGMLITGFLPVFDLYFKIGLSWVAHDMIGRVGLSLFFIMMTMEQTYNTKKFISRLSHMTVTLEEQVTVRTVQYEEANNQLMLQNSRIMDSIDYAQRIQKSILPSPGTLQALLPDSFLLWQPRDAVGGDFFWLNSYHNTLILAVIDCTGHGVPGAMMTMTVNALFNHIFHEHWNSNPADLMMGLHLELQATLNQDRHDSLSDDGLDMSLYCIDRERGLILFTGARQDAWYSDDGKIVTVKGDRHSIGYRHSFVDFQFTVHELPAVKGEMFYLCTDGYIDQIGGPREFPMGKTKFKKLLTEIHREQPDTQKKRLLEEFERYRGDHEQRDDVTVTGFRI